MRCSTTYLDHRSTTREKQLITRLASTTTTYIIPAYYRHAKPTTNTKVHVPPPQTILKPRINLLHNLSPRVLTPIPTRLHNSLRHTLPLDQLRLLHQINIQPRTDMPRNMAMKRPHARIIRIILQHKIPRCIRVFRPLNNLHISTRGEGVICYFSIPFSLTFG